MKYAADFRRIARDALSGKWMIAVLVGLVAMLLGGTGSDGPQVKLNIDATGANASFEFAGQTIFSTGGGLDSEVAAFLIGSAIYITIAAIVMAVVYFVLGSIISIGYARFNLDLVDRGTPSFETLFGYFSYWKTTAVAKLLQSVYILLWSLLFIIPGIIATYSYAMTEFILAEHPDLKTLLSFLRTRKRVDSEYSRISISFISTQQIGLTAYRLIRMRLKLSITVTRAAVSIARHTRPMSDTSSTL